MGEISFRDIESNSLCKYWKFLSRDEKNIIKNQSILPVLQLNEHPYKWTLKVHISVSGKLIEIEL